MAGMYSRTITVFLAMVAGLVLVPAMALAEPLVIQYTEEDKLKTSLRWLDLRPSVIRPSGLAAAAVDRDVVPPAKAATLSAEKLGNYADAAIGKLLFVKPSGDAGSCTATFVATNNVLFTAANCIINSEGVAHEDLIFISAYGSVAQQTYGINCVAMPSEWTTAQGADQWRHNYAFLRTARTSTYGGLGLTNALVPKRLSQAGFSDVIEDGLKMQRLDADAYMTKDGLVGTAYTGLGGATSGNPWLRNSIIYSISSHYDSEYPSILLGPRITSDTMTLLNRMRKGC